MRPDGTLGVFVKTVTAVLLGIILSVCGGVAAFAADFTQIFVKLPAGTVLSLEVDSSDSIENVKQKVQDQTAILPAEQSLSLAGTPLVDGRTLADYNIQAGSILDLGYARPLALITTAFPSLTLAADYAVTIDAGPAFSPLTFAFTAGALPAGVTFDTATGAFEGRPTTAGSYAFTITATRDDGTSLAIPFAGTIAPAAAVPADPADTLAETGVDPVVPVSLAGMLLLAGILVLLGRRRRRA